MKVSDIIERTGAYGLQDEPAPGVTKAAARKQTSDIVNQNKRASNAAQNANDEANIANARATKDQQRDQMRIPTGQPNRAAYDAMRTDLYNRRGIKQQ